MAKNYNTERVAGLVSRHPGIIMKWETATIEADTHEGIGNKTWGKIDFLIRNGYSLELV